ncbi:endoplasmic reticulum junction formation protein lunapark-B [Toxorhynchites rutilus septentrionalis]|uniref:endoplasmic reticulum junction formation protein lunapark-B n=1 Tax=Toxorhynchites rutilus septentrionalis TaxID=329112 RepID=UPI00247A3948|nr:endoplasmic reticulum junction formation protein lunapark-B [Toxorhynchites rutilus septentrionalis]XP_055641338.1 endoplasmic reticulum junction formation protein lunapark-B [Toxorhynchites rutilus septentrionalis]
MGAIISRFRKEKTTCQVLENLEEKIEHIEAYTISTQEQRKRFVGSFLVISIGLYVLSSLIFYFVFFPSTWNDRIVRSLPLLICPLIITLIKKVLAWYFERKVIRNTNKLKLLRAEKKKILEQVMDKETYKVAVDILNKFGDNSQKAQTQSLSALTPMKRAQQAPVTPKGIPQIRTQLPSQSAPGPQMPMAGIRPAPVTPIGFNPNIRTASPAPQAAHFQQQSAGLIHRPIGMVPPQTMPYRRTPYPIINHSQKGVLEKMVDYLVGDGPNSRFAMICKECLMHNGMALQEEYEFAAFRCAFCGAFNPAKKLRPMAPKLPFEQVQLTQQRGKRLSVSSSGEESESPLVEENPADAETVPEQEENVAVDNARTEADEAMEEVDQNLEIATPVVPEATTSIESDEPGDQPNATGEEIPGNSTDDKTD